MKKRPRYTPEPSKVLFHIPTGREVSIGGACPYYSDDEAEEWELRTDGYEIRNNDTNTTGVGGRGFETLAAAQEYIDQRLNPLHRS